MDNHCCSLTHGVPFQSGTWTKIVAGGDAGGLARVGAAVASQPDDGGDGANLFLFGGLSATALENDLLQLSISSASPPVLNWAKVVFVVVGLPSLWCRLFPCFVWPSVLCLYIRHPVCSTASRLRLKGNPQVQEKAPH